MLASVRCLGDRPAQCVSEQQMAEYRAIVAAIITVCFTAHMVGKRRHESDKHVPRVRNKFDIIIFDSLLSMVTLCVLQLNHIVSTSSAYVRHCMYGDNNLGHMHSLCPFIISAVLLGAWPM